MISLMILLPSKESFNSVHILLELTMSIKYSSKDQDF